MHRHRRGQTLALTGKAKSIRRLRRAQRQRHRRSNLNWPKKERSFGHLPYTICANLHRPWRCFWNGLSDYR